MAEGGSEGIQEKELLKTTFLSRPKSRNQIFVLYPLLQVITKNTKKTITQPFQNLIAIQTHLDFFKRTPDLENLIEDQDVIFVGGGNTKSMLAVWKDWGLDIYLKEAYERGVVMSGVSAGAICWFEKGITDSWSNDLRIMDCLGFVKGNCCPHYDEEPERKPTVANFLSEQLLDSCLVIEGESALHIKNGKVYASIAFRKGKRSYLVNIKNKEIMETPFVSKDISSN